MTSTDLEKQAPAATIDATTKSINASDSGEPNSPREIPILSTFKKINDFLERLHGFESRGITRVLPEERNPPSFLADAQVFVMWFSANISVNNLTAGLLGPLVFQLGFLDSALCAVFGALLGSASTAYMSIWGPISGNRTMVKPCPYTTLISVS